MKFDEEICSMLESAERAKMCRRKIPMVVDPASAHEDLGDLLNSSAESKSARVVCAGVPVSLTIQLTRR